LRALHVDVGDIDDARHLPDVLEKAGDLVVGAPDENVDRNLSVEVFVLLWTLFELDDL